MLIIGFALNFQVFSQTEFVPGFYIINKNAKYAEPISQHFDYMPYRPDGMAEVEKLQDAGYLTYTDDGAFVTNPDGEFLYTSFDWYSSNNINLREGQIVIAYMLNNNRVYCFDLDGHPAVFSSITNLTKAPTNGSIGSMKEFEEEIMDGPTLGNGYYWILSQNTANGTVKIQLPTTTIEIKVEKISFWKKSLDSIYNQAFETAGDEGVQITTVK